MVKNMEFNLPVDTTHVEKFIVEEKHIADMLGSGKVAVLSTPSMILMMEHTAMNHAQQHLPDGWITVGTKVCISHLRATKQGVEVSVKAKLTSFENKHLVYDVEAFEGEHKIGEGTHERHIVNKEKFMARL